MLPTLTEEIRYMERELANRQFVFPKQIAEGNLKPEKAEHELACTRATLETLKKQLNQQNPNNNENIV